MWLVRRLQVAGRGAELLERKRQVLLREQARVRAEAASARQSWEEAAAQAGVWGMRAAMLDGAARLDLLARHIHDRAYVQVSWSNVMGARLPAAEPVLIPDPPKLSGLGGSAATVELARVCAAALQAAARCAAAERALRALSAELVRTSRRLRALQQRLIPQHEQALARLDLVLDEGQREQAIRVRWLTQQPPRGTRPRP